MGTVLIALLMILATGPAGADSFDQYRAGNFTKAINEVSLELQTPLTSEGVESRLKMTSDIVAQEPSIPYAKLSQVLSAAAAKQPSLDAFLRRTINAQLAALKTLPKNDKISVHEGSKKLNAAVKLPEDPLKYPHDKKAQLWALGILFSRKSLTEKNEPDWLFLLGKAKMIHSKNGAEALKAYLERTKSKKHQREAHLQFQCPGH